MTNILSFEMEKTATWRSKKAERHPEDYRNLEAVKLLQELSKSEAQDEEAARKRDIAECDVESPHYADYPEVRNDVLKSIGFGFNPTSVDQVIRKILSDLDIETEAPSS